MDEEARRRILKADASDDDQYLFRDVCSFHLRIGTVKAADYIENVIKVNQWGFESADAVTMARNDGLNSQINVGQDSLELAVAKRKWRKSS